MASKKKKRKKRGSRYHTGQYSSIKLLNGPIKYRSGWEKLFMEWLDANDDIQSYEYESIVIGYISNFKSQKLRHYYPDLFVHYVDGHNELIEIKPKSKLLHKLVLKKAQAAEVWCKEHNATYKLVTENDLKQLGILI